MTPDIETPEFRRQLQLLHRDRHLIVACTVLGAAVALVLSFLLTRSYVADAALTISRSKIGEGQMASEALSTANFRPLIEIRAVASQVIKETRLDEPPSRVSPSRFFGDVVEIEEVRNSAVLLVHGRLSDPTLVAAIVNRVAELGSDTARRISQQE